MALLTSVFQYIIHIQITRSRRLRPGLRNPVAVWSTLVPLSRIDDGDVP